MLSDVIRTQLRDPRVEGVVITHVRVSRDLSVAWVYYSTYDGGTAAVSELQVGLDRASGFLRSHLARELTTRTVPDLRFRFDDVGERSRELDRLIDTAVATSKSGESIDSEPQPDPADETAGQAGQS